MRKMTKNYYTIRVTDPSECSEHYATIDVGDPDGLLLTRCIPTEHEDEIKGNRPTKKEWRKFGVDQRYLISKSNVEPCDNTLCALNERGKRELKSVERCGGFFGRFRTCNKISRVFSNDPNLYELVNDNKTSSDS